MTQDITVSDLDIMTQAINYRRWLFGQVSPYLGQRVFEIGAGIGNYTEFMLDRECLVCLEPHPEAVARLNSQFGPAKNVFIYQGDITAISVPELAQYRCDTGICFNVLEHVEDHVAALANIRQVLVPGGRLLLIVPAVPMIMGTVDQSLGHFRRYTPALLREVFTQSGYHIEQLYYMNFVGVLGWFWNNRVIKRAEESSGQIAFYDKYLVPWLVGLEKIIPPPIGLSLVCVAKV